VRRGEARHDDLIPFGSMTPAALDHNDVRDLSRVSNLRGAGDLALTWGAIAGAIALAHWIDRWYGYLLAMIFIGSRQNALATLAHEAWHALCFSNRTLNHAVGAWLYAYPIGIPYSHDRRRHLRHHRDVGRDFDPDWRNYSNDGRQTPAGVLRYLLGVLCGGMLLTTLWSFLVRRQPRIGVADAPLMANEEPRPNGRREPSVAREFVGVAETQIVLFAVMWAATGAWWTCPLLWWVPLATFAGFFANFRALIEHVTTDDNAPPDARLRDIEAGALERLLLSPCHFNYHALHHAYVSIPHRRLPEAKRRIVTARGAYPYVVWHGYVRALRDHLHTLRPPEGR
jgi:fatty acid desaturase